MKALVIYESMFGNTLAIAESIAKGLSSMMATELLEVGDAPRWPFDDIDLLVVGGPTHAFGMSRRTTREGAKQETEKPLISQGIGIREWLDDLPKTTRRVQAATFDTRVDKPRLPGSAAASAEKKLRKAGCSIAEASRSFYVDGMTGPLLDGELARARGWGEQLGSELAVEEVVS